MRRSLIPALLALFLLAGTAHADQARLLGRAVLPARTFADGPPSGALLGAGPINGVPVPFTGQPVQGFSAALPAGEGRYWVMPDNGYGSIENSADFDLRVYLIRPDLETAFGGSGAIKVLDHIELRDPDHKIPFAIVNDFSSERVLTGADFDIESMQRSRDGTLWFGDEFGPFLLHTDADGRVLHAPYPLPDPDIQSHPPQELRAAQNPFSEESSTLRVMNALRADAQAHGDRKTPVVSPDFNLLADGDPATAVGSRKAPPAGSGVPAASSEIMSVTSLHAAGFKVVPYTVNDPARMAKLLKLGVDGIISDRPDLLHQAIAAFDANGDGTPGDYLNPDGTVNAAKFDAEAHRGGRDLRPENTLPSMEVGLDNLANTLETDNGITKDGVPVLSHDPYIDTGKCRRTDGQPYGLHDQVLIKDLTLHDLQTKFICDGLIRPGTPQANDRSLSPVAVAFAEHEHLVDPYVVPTTQQLFDFAKFYVDWYKTGPGASDPHATTLWQNAARVRFNVETKLNPRSDRDSLGNRYDQRTIGPVPFAEKVAGVIESNGLQDRADVQSFDFRTLRTVVKEFPNLLTVPLWGDSTVFADPSVAGSGDGANLQPQGHEENTRWLAGLPWPWRHTADETPFRVQTSGGFEGMAIEPNGKLLPMLEKPQIGAPTDHTSAYEFDPRAGGYTGKRWQYPYDPKGTSIGDFQLLDSRHGLVIERDNSQGNLSGFKALEEVALGAPGTTMTKQPAADLMNISDPAKISLPAQPGDVGLGNPFAFPFQTIEDLVILDRRHVVVLNDNNFPFSIGRHVGSGKPDDNELIVLRLPRRIGKG